MKSLPDETETLRLVTAFLKIADPEARQVILAIAEAKANGRSIAAEELRPLADDVKQS